MSDSLVIANAIELLGGGVASVNPLCPGAVFYLQPGFTQGAPQPTTDFVASLILDGERPFGRRASNRTITLPVWIKAPNRQILAAAREVLQQAVDQDYFTITWTRDPASGNPGGLPQTMVLDCFRAQPSTPAYNTLWEKQGQGMGIQLVIPALPYARSATQVQVSFAAPVPANPPVSPPPSPVTLDTFATLSSPLFSQSSQCVIGPNSGCWDPDSFGDPGGQVTQLSYASSFSSPVNLTGMAALQFWFGLGSRYYANLEYHGKTHGVTISFTLTDSGGNTLSFSRSNLLLPCSSSAQVPTFTRVVIPLPATSPTFSYPAVTRYAVTVTNRSDRILRLSNVTAYLDNLTALPGSQAVNPVTRGAVYTIQVQGTARSPVSMSFTQPPSAGTVTTIVAAGPGSYTVPANTVYLKAEATGGGGAGAGMTTSGVGAGGAGAEYSAETVFPAAAAQVIPYVVGAGDTAGASPSGGQPTVFGPGPSGTLQVTAGGGGSVPTNSNTAGAGGAGSMNSVEHPGGAGRANPAGTFGGGGGSSGGTLLPGNTPIGSGSVLFTSTGTSNWTCPAGVTQVLAECWGAGAGGGGGNNTSNYGGGAGGGSYWSALIPVTPGDVYPAVVGTGGAGGAASTAGSNGGQSSFTGDSGRQVIASGGTGGPSSSSSHTPGGAGGSTGTGTTTFPGGNGGNGYPYSGGGGSSAGPSAQGNPGGSPGGATAPSGGGAGGAGSGPQNGTGNSGTAPGGGGGGSFNAYTGGSGANGQVRLTFPASTGAPTSVGGTAVAGGGAGGNGAASAGNPGSAGAAPGGGGGGAFSSGTTQAGGNGATGQLKITPYIPGAFKTLIVHRPPLGAQKTFQPLVSVGAGGDVPNGSTQYTMPQPVTGVNADFGGTYTVYLINSSWNGTGSRTITVTVSQFEFAGGPSYTVSTLPVSLTPSQVTNGIVTAGVLTLPVKAVAPDNTGGYYTVAVTDTNTSDRFLDCIFLDTMGQTVVINQPTTGYLTYYLDAPDPISSLGRFMGSQGGRPNAISVMDNTPYISGGTLHVEPGDGDNQLFVYCADGTAPNVSLAYFPCFFYDRTQ
jgi:hypothetical protein